MNSPVTLILSVLTGLLLAGSASAHSVARDRSQPATEVNQIEVVLADVPVVTHQSKTVSFRKDVIADKIVVMDFIYTSCTTICPVQSAILAGLQTALGDRLGKEIKIVSISIDPVTDVPAVLRQQAERYGSAPSWQWITGKPANITTVLNGLRASVGAPEEHPGYFMIGTARAKRWTRVDGFASVERLLEEIEAMGSSNSR
jgi:protein SCO1/2